MSHSSASSPAIDPLVVEVSDKLRNEISTLTTVGGSMNAEQSLAVLTQLSADLKVMIDSSKPGKSADPYADTKDSKDSTKTSAEGGAHGGKTK